MISTLITAGIINYMCMAYKCSFPVDCLHIAVS